MNEINLVKKTYEELQDEVIKLTTDKFLLKTKIENAIEYIKHYETIRGYYEYQECGYDEYNYKNDAIKFKYCLSELLKEVK